MKEKTADIDILEEKEKKAIENLKGTYWYVGEEGLEENIKIVLNLIESLIAENKELKEQEDYTSVYLKGVYDERNKWQNKIKDIINRLEYDISKTKEIKTTRYSDYDRIRLKAYVTKSKEMIERLQSLLGKE